MSKLQKENELRKEFENNYKIHAVECHGIPSLAYTEYLEKEIELLKIENDEAEEQSK